MITSFCVQRHFILNEKVSHIHLFSFKTQYQNKRIFVRSNPINSIQKKLKMIINSLRSFQLQSFFSIQRIIQHTNTSFINSTTIWLVEQTYNSNWCHKKDRSIIFLAFFWQHWRKNQIESLEFNVNTLRNWNRYIDR